MIPYTLYTFLHVIPGEYIIVGIELASIKRKHDFRIVSFDYWLHLEYALLYSLNFLAAKIKSVTYTLVIVICLINLISSKHSNDKNNYTMIMGRYDRSNGKERKDTMFIAPDASYLW